MNDWAAICELKVGHCRLLDARDWYGWRRLFTDDSVSDTWEAAGDFMEGADKFVAVVRGSKRG